MLSLFATLAVLPAITEAARECTDAELSYWTGCFAWPSYLHVTCKKGWVPGEADAGSHGSHRCGFLGEKGLCLYDGDTLYDHGCGCDEGTDCMDQDCELGNWGPWSDCSAGCTDKSVPVTNGVQTRTRPIITEQAYGGAECDEVGEERQCTSHECSKDCEVGAWGAWSKCNKVCSTGIQYRKRKITQPMVGYGQPCQTLSDIRKCNETPCFWYTLTGRSGGEQVKVVDGNDVHNFKLSLPQTLGTNRKITIEFKNDKGNDRDVWFNFRNAASASGDSSLAWQTTGEIVHEKNWSKWKCGSSKENKACKDVRAGYLKWGGKYTVTFDGSVVTGPWSSGR